MKIIVAQRGRMYRGQKPKLEVRKDKCSNTITTVTKDNYVLERKGEYDTKIKRV